MRCRTFAALMKLTCVTILFICLLAATFSKWFVIASFELNKNYIARTLCVNRNKPFMHCNGHCYLNKQLQKEQGQDTGTESNEKAEPDFVFFLEALTIQLPSLPVSTHKKQGYYQQAAPQEFNPTFFHPPCC
jgi:hypothetical protein